ncbi:MAG: helix-turn-helix domain-containing protein [Thermoanaerobaculales bacterium]|nr:helix-turn-helix domain-containing protein [Thermoanaerobaculales bacterium]
MTPEETAFFQELGSRIATLRKDRGLTQTQLGEMIGVSQQQVVSFEKGRRKVPVSALPKLSKALGVPVEELIGTESKPGKRGPTPKLQRQLEQLQELPRSKQRFVAEMLDTVLQQTGT